MTFQQVKEKANKKHSGTKRYDVVAKKIRKLLSATAQTFIPELCEALRLDWYPELSEEQIQNDKEARDSIRQKIFKDWSSEQGKYSQDNIWIDDTIQNWIPGWLKNPIKLNESTRERLKRANEIKIARKNALSEREKQKLEDVANKLPDSVIIPRQPEPRFEDKWSPIDKDEQDKELHAMGMGKFGDTGKSIRELYGDITDAVARLFEALTQRDDMPDESDDLIVDYIKPTREFRRSLALEFDETQRARIHNWLHYTGEIMEDMLEMIKQAEK